MNTQVSRTSLLAENRPLLSAPAHPSPASASGGSNSSTHTAGARAAAPNRPPASPLLFASPPISPLATPGARSVHPELSLAFAPASFSSASNILSFGGGSGSDDGSYDDEDDDGGAGEVLRIADIEEESSEEEDDSWRRRRRRRDDADGGQMMADEDQRHRPPLRGRRSRDLSSESTAALLARQQSQLSFESKHWLGGGSGGKDLLRASTPHQTISGRLAPPSPHSTSPDGRRRSRSRSRYRRPGSPIVESATSASDDSPPRAEPSPAPVPIATPPAGRSVRFNPRMKTRTAYGSYQSDASVDLISASPAASFLAWRYPGQRRSGSVISAKRAPAVASWKAYYGALDNNAAPGSSSPVSYSSRGPPSISPNRATASRNEEATAATFGATVWERLGSLDYWLWKTGLDDWTESGCCSLPNWDEQEEWAGNADRRRAGGWSSAGGVGESRPGGIF